MLGTEGLIGLFLLWAGAISFGVLLVLRGRRHQGNPLHDLSETDIQMNKDNASSIPPAATPLMRRIEALLMFLGTAALILGLGFLGLSAV